LQGTGIAKQANPDLQTIHIDFPGETLRKGRRYTTLDIYSVGIGVLLPSSSTQTKVICVSNSTGRDFIAQGF
jgi:hypothetical protein